MSLQTAIAQLQAEVDEFGQGSSRQPKEGTSDWFLLRAKVIGLGALKRMEQLKMDRSTPAANRHFSAAQRALKLEVGADDAS